jgi:hypothetical protein
VDHKDCVSGVDHLDDLQESSPASLAHHQEFFFTDLLGKRWAALANDHFRVFPIHAMFGNVVSIPVDPPELHDRLLPAILTGERVPGKTGRGAAHVAGTVFLEEHTVIIRAVPETRDCTYQPVFYLRVVL